MYDPENYEGSTVWKCPRCGKFVSLEKGFYDRMSRNPEGSYVIAFCDERCADSWHGRLPSQVDETEALNQRIDSDPEVARELCPECEDR